MTANGKRRPVLILGLGNPLYGDDGIGSVVTEALARREFPAEVELLDGGTAGLGLLEVIAERQHLLVVDAVEMGQPAGTWMRLRPEEAISDESTTQRTGRMPLSPHQLGLIEVLALADQLEIAPQEVQIYAIQPGYLGWGQGLSPAVQESLPQVVAAISAEIRHTQE